MPSLIEQIIAKMEQIPITGGDKIMVIKKSDFGLEFMDAFFAQVLLEDTITLTGAGRTATADSVTVTGTSGLYKYKDLGLVMKFDVQNSEVIGNITGTFPTSYKPAMEVITWIKAGNIVLSTSISEKLKLVSFDFKLDILSSTQQLPLLPVEISNQSGDTWSLVIKEGTDKAATIDELVSLLAGQAIDQFIPSALASILSGIKINSLEVSYNTTAKTVSFFSIGISVTNGWTIVDKKVLLLPGLQVNMTLINPTDAAARLTSGSIYGTFQLGGVNVPIYLGAIIGGGTTLWAFGLQPNEKVTLPSFSDLLGLAGGDDFMKTLPDGLSKIPQIEINKLLVNFDTAKKELTQLSFGVATASSWPIITGYFEIEKMSIDFDISHLTDPLTRTIYGTLYGLFKLGKENYVMCSIAKTVENPDWTIIGGLPPGKTLSLTLIAVKLFTGDVKVPAGVPDFAFSVLQITVVPDKKSFKFEAQSASPWQIIDKISIDVFKLDFSRDPLEPVNPIKGSVATTLQISSVGVDLSASLNNTPSGGWQFDGKTKPGDPIVIGDVIAYILEKFGVSNPPKWINTITLKDLAVSFNSTTKDFSFGASASIIFTTTEMDISVKFDLKQDTNKKYGMELAGTITLKHASTGGSSVFKIDFKTDTTDTRLKASWAATKPSEYLQFGDLATAFGFEIPEIPAGLDLALKSASLMYDFTTSTLAFALESANYGKSVFVAMKNPADKKWIFYFGLSSNRVIDLANLPIISKIATIIPQGKLEIDQINVNITSLIITKELADLINKQIQAMVTDYKTYPQLPVDGMNGQFSFSMTMNIGGSLYPVGLVVGGKSSSSGKEVMRANDPALNADNPKTTWFDIQKNFGPLYFDKVGIGYKDSHIFVLVNVMATASGLSIGLNGFGVGVAINKFDIQFNLDGISITYQSGPILVSGGFQGTFSPVNLYGDILIQTTAISIGGIGGYTEVSNKPSMFLFAVLKFPIGGPAFFFVTGLAAGFGYNRKLLIPPITGVATFPFVVWAMPGGQGPTPNPTENIAEQVNKVLGDIVQKGIVAPALGSNWLAAGINFTSFEIVNSFALLTVLFGTQLEIDLLGLSRIAIPPGSGGSIPSVAYAELAIKASYVDGTGLISIEGQLTNNSYVLAKACHLTGGFAFYFWFSGEHEGDFVITLGGYNPNYTVPAHYPKVPRLGINWQVTGNLIIKGSLYFALTSNAVMAGGMMSAVWESGNIKAWFIVQADFLIMWKPFHYDIHASTDIGASFTVDLWFTTKTITIHVGVDLHIWGPDFSGEARIHLYIISFNISFGAGSTNKPQTIVWGDFIKEMLPQKKDGSGKFLAGPYEAGANPDVCKITVTDGLLMQLSDKDGELNWIVNPEKFVVSTDSIIPSKTSAFESNNSEIVISMKPEPIVTAANTDFGIRPVGVGSSAFQSSQSIVIKGTQGETGTFHATPILKNVSKALWQKIAFDSNGNPEMGDPVKDTTLKNVLTGFKLEPYATAPSNTLPIKLEYLQYTIDPQLQHFAWAVPYVPTTDDFQNPTVVHTIMTPVAKNNREMLFDVMVNYGFTINTEINVDELADAKTYDLLAEPVMRLLGEEKMLQQSN